jgi:hypothetical protein
MSRRTCSALLLVVTLLVSACATTEPSRKDTVAGDPRIANLHRAATLPWRDGGRCVVQEASQPWPVLVERCFQALDHERIRFSDRTGRCTVASAGAAAMGLGICVLAAPQIVVGAVVIIGVVVVAAAIAEELDAYGRTRRAYPEASREDAKPRPETGPATQEPFANRRPDPKASPMGRDWLPPSPPEPSEQERRPKCEPIPVPHLGGSDSHNECANKVPNNSFPGWDVLVNGKNFDALQLATRTLWEVKTDGFDQHSRRSQQFFIQVKLPEIQRERRLAEQCGYHFVVGVRSEAHKVALEREDRSLKVVVMDWC